MATDLISSNFSFAVVLDLNMMCQNMSRLTSLCAKDVKPRVTRFDTLY